MQQAPSSSIPFTSKRVVIALSGGIPPRMHAAQSLQISRYSSHFQTGILAERLACVPYARQHAEATLTIHSFHRGWIGILCIHVRVSLELVSAVGRGQRAEGTRGPRLRIQPGGANLYCSCRRPAPACGDSRRTGSRASCGSQICPSAGRYPSLLHRDAVPMSCSTLPAFESALGFVGTYAYAFTRTAVMISNTHPHAHGR